jgi:hypothetical protein
MSRNIKVEISEDRGAHQDHNIETSISLNGYQWTSLPVLSRSELEYLRDQIDNYLSVSKPINKDS